MYRQNAQMVPMNHCAASVPTPPAPAHSYRAMNARNDFSLAWETSENPNASRNKGDSRRSSEPQNYNVQPTNYAPSNFARDNYGVPNASSVIPQMDYYPAAGQRKVQQPQQVFPIFTHHV